MGTHWEFERNIKGTCWKQRKNEKNPPTPSKEKTRANNECMLSLPIGCMKFHFQNCSSPFLFPRFEICVSEADMPREHVKNHRRAYTHSGPFPK
jgi:hypothetical protein